MNYGSPRISVICSTYNRPKSLLRMLDLFNGQKCVDLKRCLEVCVVDDGSSHDLAGQFPDYRFGFEYVYRPRANDNTSRVYSSRNVAAARTHGDYLLQMDDDLEFQPYLINLLQSLAGSVSEEHWAWGARISNNIDVDRSGYESFERGLDGRWYDGKCQWQETHWESSSSAGMFLPRQTWREIGGYDENFDGCMGAADQELALRVQKLGGVPGKVKIYLAPYFMNIEDSETGSWRMSMIDRRQRQKRNEDLFWEKHPDARSWTNV